MIKLITLTLLEGHFEYYVQNDDFNQIQMMSIILKFDISEDIKTKCLQTTSRLNMFKFILLKNIAFDIEGRYIKNFILMLRTFKF